ncbi:MAG: hypothetical protein WCI55_02710 [Armatimonadota bacterium]
MRRICFRFVALGSLFTIVGLALWPFPQVSRPLVILSGPSFVIAIAIWIRIWRDSAADPYSLDKLNEMVKEGTYNEDDVPEIDHDGDKYCLCCHTVYGSQFGTCPTCAKK